MSAAESYDATIDTEQSDGARGYNLSPARRAFVVEHAQQPGWTTGRMAAELGVPPYIVSGWLRRRDVSEAIQARWLSVKADELAPLTGSRPYARARPVASPAPAVASLAPPPTPDESPWPPAPETETETETETEPYSGVEVSQSGAILTPELKTVIVDKVRALCADAAHEMAEEAVRRVLRAELRELTIVTVREALVEIIAALAPLPSAIAKGAGGHGE